MRWFSSLAILFYLSVLCTPQAFAVHDIRLSPLADSQLYALTPALQQHLQPAGSCHDDDDEPPALLLLTNTTTILPAVFCPVSVSTIVLQPLFSNQVQPRAPPFPPLR